VARPGAGRHGVRHLDDRTDPVEIWNRQRLQKQKGNIDASLQMASWKIFN
jgi:hypothetical protein